MYSRSRFLCPTCFMRPVREWKSFLWLPKCLTSRLIRSVSKATWISGDPESVGWAWFSLTIFVFCSLLITLFCLLMFFRHILTERGANVNTFLDLRAISRPERVVRPAGRDRGRGVGLPGFQPERGFLRARA